MRLGPALFTAYRWSFSARKRMSMGRAVLASAGIAAGVTALIVVLGVMGGLQKGYIDAILEISSFHLRVEVPERAARSTSEAIAALPGVVSALEFTESELMALGPNRESRPVALTILSPHGAQRDQGFMRALGLGSLRDFPPAGGFYLGREAASALGLVPGDRLEVFSAAMDEDEGLLPLRGEFVLSGTFASGYYEYDSSLAFAASDPDNPLLSSLSTGRSIIGIKLADRWRETRVKAAVEALLPPESGRLQTWREYNRGFFGALRMEKSIMMILVGLIFIVVGINIFHALRRSLRI